jgi:hypothetical protein
MSLIPSESYSFPDHFSRTVTHSSPPEKEVAGLVDRTSSRRKKRFSFSFRRSLGSRKNGARDTLDLSKDCQENFSVVEEPSPPVEKKEVTLGASKPRATETSAAPSAKSPVLLYQGTPEPVPSLFKDDLPPEPVRKRPVAGQPAIESQLPLGNGAPKPPVSAEPAPQITAPPSAPKQTPAPHNGLAETVMSPQGLAQFFQQIVPMESAPAENLADPFQPSDNTSADLPAESESGGLEVPITPELLAQLFQAMTPAASQVPPGTNVADPFTAPEEPLSFEMPPTPAHPQIVPENNLADLFAAPEEPPSFEMPASPAQPQIVPENNPVDLFAVPEEPSQFATPMLPTPPAQPQMVPENNLADLFAGPPEPSHLVTPIPPSAPPAPPQMSIEEFFAPQNTVEEFVQPKSLPPQPRRTTIPSKVPDVSIPPARPEPQTRKSSVPPNLKRKIRWNKRAPQDQSMPLPLRDPLSQDYPAATPGMAGMPPATNAPQEWEPLFEPVQTASSDLQPVPSRELGGQVPHPVGHNSPAPHQVVPFETRALAQRKYVERRRRTTKWHRFILWESIAAGLLLLLAILGLSGVFSQPALVVIVDSLAIAAAATAVLIPIFFFAVSSPVPGEESDLGL